MLREQYKQIPLEVKIFVRHTYTQTICGANAYGVHIVSQTAPYWLPGNQAPLAPGASNRCPDHPKTICFRNTKSATLRLCGFNQLREPANRGFPNRAQAALPPSGRRSTSVPLAGAETKQRMRHGKKRVRVPRGYADRRKTCGRNLFQIARPKRHRTETPQ